MPSGILDKVYDPSPQHQSTYCNADSTPPDTLGGDRARFTASAVAPESASVCQLPGYHIDQPHSWHARGGWVPSPIFCKIQPRSTDELLCSGVFLKRLVLLSVTDITIGSEGRLGRAQGGGSWLKQTLLCLPAACLPGKFSGGLSEERAHRNGPFQVGCGMRGQEP